MVVILIVNPAAEAVFHPSRSERLSTTNTSTTSISFVSSSSSSQVDPENSYATTKEEEWVTKKKVELTTKRQIETRVKRQVVLEDGKVVEDSGPIVTTNTTEDTEKQESKQTEHRQLGDDEGDGTITGGGKGDGAEMGLVPVGQGGVLKEVKERTVKSREEKEERVETEDVHHLGNISDEAYLAAVQRQGREGGDLRTALERSGLELQRIHEARVLHQSCKTRKVVDTDDARHLSELQPDGRLVTETQRTTEHEEVNNTEEPDDDEGDRGAADEDHHKESSQHFTKTKDQDFVHYLANGKKIGEQMRYEAETVSGGRLGDASLLPEDGADWERLRRARRARLQQPGAAAVVSPAHVQDRKDALTKRPLDFDLEEETRKVETSKWLEHHFGSESRSSKDSTGDDDELPATGTTTSFINVTMKSTKNKTNLRVPSPVTNGNSRVFVSPGESTDPPTSYFQGVSEWRSPPPPERPTRTSSSSGQGGVLRDRVQVLPTGPHHTFTPPEPPSPPYISSQGSKNLRGSQGSNLNGLHQGPESSSPFQSLSYTSGHNRYFRAGSSPPADRNSPYHARTSSEEDRGRPSSPRVNGHRNYNGFHRDEDRERLQRRLEEPVPDYSPPTPSPTPPPSPSPPQDKKKIYQRTRFAADIPPLRVKQAQATQTTPPKTSLGESFRKFVGKFRSASKEKRRGKKSRSPSPQSRTYQAFDAVDGERGVEREVPVAPPRSRHSHSQAAMGPGQPVPVTRYYLGEDPFGGSIYGREREYLPFRGRNRDEERNARNRQLSNGTSTSTSTLGRFSKSTSRLGGSNHIASHSVDYSDRGGVQTLPRKLRQREVERVNSSPLSGSYTAHIVNNGPAKPARTYRSNLLRSQSFNVHAGGLAPDPALHKSNPQLHRLEESPPPLKSPGIVTSISRSTRDLSQPLDEEDYRRPYDHSSSMHRSTGQLNGFSGRTVHDTKKKIFMKSLQDRAPELFKTLHGNEVDDRKVSPEMEERGRMFTSTPLRNVGRSAVEYSSSFRSSNASSPLERVHSPAYTSSVTRTNSGEVVNRSVTRRGSNDDYTETVRITSKSDDPLRPSVTDTVQSFSKKVVPVRGGRGRETIQSSETKSITKSRYRGGDRYLESNTYAPRNGGVVIEVRNHK